MGWCEGGESWPEGSEKGEFYGLCQNMAVSPCLQASLLDLSWSYVVCVCVCVSTAQSKSSSEYKGGKSGY